MIPLSVKTVNAKSAQKEALMSMTEIEIIENHKILNEHVGYGSMSTGLTIEQQRRIKDFGQCMQRISNIE